MSKAVRTAADEIWKNRVEKINVELFTLTYGSVVSQLCRDLNNNYCEVNKQLEIMGENIGVRLIEDFLARTGAGRCNSFKETGEIISKVGFKIFLNIVPQVTNWTDNGKQFSLVFDENPLAEFVELPDDGKAVKELWYSNVLCGVLKGALQMVQLDVDVSFVSDVLRGHDQTEIKLRLIRYLKDEIPAGED
ncbi:TRAPP complex core subunit BET3 [Ascoidea rubescens DSM 1968]|uniref:Trafficking protein particle complex subunit BET3 n=1 Tax=Ascoidea rubescens DSM 1968 TaxID=1344418 RepID=A0A1D2VDH8_9ASCO|nr:TRAPP I complex [Ascoidea rubescens DSM 1968]ODV59754.1 TRAPP I complex [Ascoidea rubescens DSM 1968]